jgi:hypothetical protein
MSKQDRMRAMLKAAGLTIRRKPEQDVRHASEVARTIELLKRAA